MIDKIIRKGMLSGKDSTLVTQIETMPEDGLVYLFYIDANYNITKPYHNIKHIINSFKFVKENFSIGYLNDIVRAIDEDAYQKDYVTKSLFMVWVLDGEKIVVNVGATFKCFCIDHLEWEADMIYSTCNFPSNGGNYHYIGSGAALGAVEHFTEEEDVLVFTEDTQFYYTQKLNINIINPSNLPLKKRDYMSMMNESLWSNQILKKQPSKDIFIAIISN